MNLPSKSILFEQSKNYDYIDSFNFSLKKSDVNSSQLLTAFFKSSPNWVNKLFVLRNKLAGLIGLKAEMTDMTKLNPPYAKNQKLGLFCIYEITEDEVVLGENDKHLNFKVSLMVERGDVDELIISTVVTTNNLVGRVYFFVVKRFHRIIVPVIGRRMVKNI